jgi:hypothetical protein
MKNKWIKMTAAAVAIVGFSASVQATLVTLTPGTSFTSLSGATSSLAGGTLVGSVLNSPLTGGYDTGTLTSFVESGVTANPYAGGLTFVYAVNLTSGQFIHLTLNGYGSALAVSIGYDASNGGTLTPTTVDRVSGTGSPIDVYWGSENTSGLTDYIEVFTPFTSVSVVTDNIIDGGTAGAQAWAPNLPDGGATVMLLGAALSAMGLLRRKLIA